MPRLMLIAMSGVRIVDPELRAQGLTLPGFIERGNVIASMPSLGLLTIAGAVPDTWEATYHEIDAVESLQALIDQEPDLVALSSLSARVDDAYQVLDEFRRQGITTVIGGLHASVMPDEAAKHADAVVMGQGEWIWPKVLADFENGNLQERYNAMHVTTPLQETPLPRYDLIDPKRYNRIPLQSTRGCPLDCAFCAASRLISPYKRKSIDRIRQEIELISSIWPDPFIELADDNTFVNKKWAIELAALMGEFPKIKWFTETDVSLADNEPLLEALAKSGCAQVLIGLESESGEALSSQADEGNWKARRRDRYKSSIARIQDAGISVNGCFIFGFDHDTPDTFDRTWDFIQELNLSEVQVTLLTPFPGTKLQRDLAQQGRLLKPRYWDQCTLFDVTYQPANFSPTELQTRFTKMVQTVYAPGPTQKRKELRSSIYRKRKANDQSRDLQRSLSRSV